MSTSSPGTPKKCRLILQQCLAIQLSKPGHPPDDFWMYDNGYTIFQNFLSANLQCWWNGSLVAATKVLRYLGHISPGMLLISGEPCALEVIRNAYGRSVLKPPATYMISAVGDIDDCIVTPIPQTQFTPLTEALCDVIMDLTSLGQSATIENIKKRLQSRFPHMQQPSIEVIYDTLVQLMQEYKIYQTSKGYFIVTPEKRRSRSKSKDFIHEEDQKEPKTMLMSSNEALRSLYGEISTERAGDQTHQCIQTNLADVICGGNPNDKILYPRSLSKLRSASFPSKTTLERRHSLRFFGSSKRLQRSASTKSLSRNCPPNSASKEATPIPSEPSPNDANLRKNASSQSLLSRIFRRSGRSKSKSKQIETYSAQFPPPEWFNSKTVHLHSVGTQTLDYHEIALKNRVASPAFFDGSDVSQRSLSLPRRRHHRRNLSSESTFFISSRDCSPVRRGKSPSFYCGSLPRSIHSTPGNSAYYRSSSKKSKTLSSADKLHSNEHKTSRLCSGPSSIDSGKMTYVTSGPSSFDSEKLSSTHTSTHSSLESHVSESTVTTSIQAHNPTIFISNDTRTNEQKNNNFKGYETSFGYSKLNNQTTNDPITSNNGILVNNIIKIDTGDPVQIYSENMEAMNESFLNCKFDNAEDHNKFVKNNNMNNSKVVQSPTLQSNFFYKNVLKNIQHDSKNICDLKETKQQMTGSIGSNLQDQDQTMEIKKINSNLDLKNNHTEKISYDRSGSMIVMKKSMSVSSEPNLTNQIETNRITILVKENDKKNDRRLSFNHKDEPIEEIYDFPSLSDLSFNFTSLAAQKILHGDNINSVDTLLELNINQERQNFTKRKNDPNDGNVVCTDFGLV